MCSSDLRAPQLSLAKLAHINNGHHSSHRCIHFSIFKSFVAWNDDPETLYLLQCRLKSEAPFPYIPCAPPTSETRLRSEPPPRGHCVSETLIKEAIMRFEKLVLQISTALALSRTLWSLRMTTLDALHITELIYDTLMAHA